MLSFPAPEASAKAEAYPAARSVILVVEDNDFVAGLVDCVLKRRGQTPVRARDGAECERLVEQHGSDIALVMIDCRLPDTDGITLCGRLRARLPRVPVLLSSGHNYAGPRELTDGPTSFLAKPFLPAQLQHEIDSLLHEAA